MLREIDFLFERIDSFNCVAFVKTSYLNTEMLKSESSESHTSRARAVGYFLENLPQNYSFEFRVVTDSGKEWRVC